MKRGHVTGHKGKPAGCCLTRRALNVINSP
jgi:hypothetical protein